MIRNLVLAGLGLTMAACSKPPVAVALTATTPSESATWRPFADTSPWNTPIPADAKIDDQSDELMADFAGDGAMYININQWSVPVFYVDMASTPIHEPYDLYPNRFGRGFEYPRSIPIPADAEPLRPSSGAIAIVDKQRMLEWDMKQSGRNAEGRWFTGFGAVTSLRGSGVSAPWNETETPNQAASALPSGFPLIAGLLRVDDVKAGHIPHALMIASPSVRTDAFVRPASTARFGESGVEPSETGLPLGVRIQLDPDFDVDGSGLSPEGKTIARALQVYGAFVGDVAGANVLFAEASPKALAAWEDLITSEEIRDVFSPEMMTAHFRVIDMGDLITAEPVAP
jgi:hypothetical protein